MDCIEIKGCPPKIRLYLVAKQIKSTISTNMYCPKNTFRYIGSELILLFLKINVAKLFFDKSKSKPFYGQKYLKWFPKCPIFETTMN